MLCKEQWCTGYGNLVLGGLSAPCIPLCGAAGLSPRAAKGCEGQRVGKAGGEIAREGKGGHVIAAIIPHSPSFQCRRLHLHPRGRRHLGWIRRGSGRAAVGLRSAPCGLCKAQDCGTTSLAVCAEWRSRNVGQFCAGNLLRSAGSGAQRRAQRRRGFTPCRDHAPLGVFFFNAIVYLSYVCSHAPKKKHVFVYFLTDYGKALCISVAVVVAFVVVAVTVIIYLKRQKRKYRKHCISICPPFW